MSNDVFEHHGFTQPAQTCRNNSDFALALALAAALSQVHSWYVEDAHPQHEH
jgi:hypothetical protein